MIKILIIKINAIEWLLSLLFVAPAPSRYITGEDGLKRLQTVRLDDNSIVNDNGTDKQ